MFRSKSKKVKTGLKLNVLFNFFLQFLVENIIFSNYLPFNWIALKLKCSADQILAVKSEFVSLFYLLRVTIRSFSNNWHVCAPAQKI